MRSTLESAVTNQPETNTILYAAIVDTKGNVVAHSTPALEGQPTPQLEDLKNIVEASALDQLRFVLQERRYELREQILAGNTDFGAIRIGVSTLFVRAEIIKALTNFAYTAVIALAVSTMVATLLAQWMLRPIHVIQSGLTRLGRGELDVRLDLPGQEFADLGSSFEAVSAQLSAVRNNALPATSTLDRVRVGHGEPRGRGRALLAGRRVDVQQRRHARAAAGVDGQQVGLGQAGALAPRRQRSDPATGRACARRPQVRRAGGRAARDATEADQEAPEHLLLCHAIDDAKGKFIGAMVVARNLVYLNQVHTTLNYSRKLAALGRLMAGVAHEVKNPLNAMTIHLELLKQKLGAMREPITVPAGPSGGSKTLDLTKHVNVIGDEIKRLDQVVVGFLKFARPDELKLQPVHLSSLVSEVLSMTAPEAERRGIAIKTECPPSVPEINGDPGMLQQALLNLTINACHAMPDGGTLRIICRAGVAAAGRNLDRGHRRRDSAGESQPHLRSLLHDEGKRQRHRSVDGVPHRPAARRGGRGAVDPRSRHTVQAAVSAGVTRIYMSNYRKEHTVTSRLPDPGRAPGDCPDRRRLRDQPRADPRAAADPRRAARAAARHRAAGHRRAAGRAAAGRAAAGAVATSKPPRPRPAADKPEPTKQEPPPESGATVPTPPPVAPLRTATTPSGPEATRQIREILDNTQKMLDKVDRRRSRATIGRRTSTTAKAFMQQADEALEKGRADAGAALCRAGAEYRQATAVGPLGSLLSRYTPTK